MANASSDVNLDVLRQFSTMQATQQAPIDPSARPVGGVLPSLGFSIGQPAGIAQAKIMSYAFLGKGPALAGMYRGIFVPMDTISQWNTHDLGRVSANIEAIPIEPPHLEVPQISGMPIEGQEIRGVLIEAAHISAPTISASYSGHSAGMGIG
jgi:hypothetical protein